MYEVVFKGRLKLHLALASVLVGATIFVPPFVLLEDWRGFLLGGFFFGGCFYLLWQNELFRAWNKEHQVQRTAGTLESRGLWTMWIGCLPYAFDIAYSSIFKTAYPYRYFVTSVEGIVVFVGIIVLSLGLILDWTRLPKDVDRSVQRALGVMKESGYPVDVKLWIGIDLSIETLGQSYSVDDEYVILVSPRAVYTTDAGGIEQTLIHELSHTYLTKTKHPSHNREVIKPAYDDFIAKYPHRYQRGAILHATYWPMEIFAEDLVFKILQGSKGAWASAVEGYFRRRSAARTVLAVGRRGRWRDAQLLLYNCFCETMMEKCQMPDPEGVVKRASQRLLSRLPVDARTAFDYFHDLFMGLGDGVTVDGYGKMLGEYLSTFTGLAEGGKGSGAVSVLPPAVPGDMDRPRGGLERFSLEKKFREKNVFRSCPELSVGLAGPWPARSAVSLLLDVLSLVSRLFL